MQTKQIIEINGINLEVDLRHAVRLDTFAIGTRVKVLTKNYSGHQVKHGVVIGFEPFKNLPTVIIAVAAISYTEAKIEFLYYNSETKDTEVVVALDEDKADLDQAAFVNQVEAEISKKELEIQQLRERKAYFLDKFKTFWAPTEQSA